MVISWFDYNFFLDSASLSGRTSSICLYFQMLTYLLFIYLTIKLLAPFQGHTYTACIILQTSDVIFPLFLCFWLISILFVVIIIFFYLLFIEWTFYKTFYWFGTYGVPYCCCYPRILNEFFANKFGFYRETLFVRLMDIFT